MTLSERQKGREYEQLAEKYLRNNGYDIAEKNWQAGHKEIDLIATRENTIVFVEVKGASSRKFGHPAERVDKRKRQNLIYAAEQYIISKNLTDYDFRFDLITFFDGKLEHFENAFTADES